MSIKYRIHTTEDEPELIQFWGEASGWDKVNADAWAHRLLHPPFGRASIVVGQDTASGKILCQLAFIPSQIVVDGKEVMALRPFAPIIGPELRGLSLRNANPFAHPVPAMYQFATQALRHCGVALIYMMPDPRWVRFFRMFPTLRSGSFPLWSHALPLGNPAPLPDRHHSQPLRQWDERVNALWQKSALLHGCQVVRDTRMLPWKVGSGDYIVTTVFRGEEMVGLVASRQKGDRQWLICDLLTADTDDSLRATLAAAMNVAHQESLAAPPDKPIRKVAVLTTPVIEATVREMGFYRDQYDFPMVVQVLDEGLSKDQTDPARWYVSAND